MVKENLVKKFFNENPEGKEQARKELIEMNYLYGVVLSEADMPATTNMIDGLIELLKTEDTPELQIEAIGKLKSIAITGENFDKITNCLTELSNSKEYSVANYAKNALLLRKFMCEKLYKDLDKDTKSLKETLISKLLRTYPNETLETLIAKVSDTTIPTKTRISILKTLGKIMQIDENIPGLADQIKEALVNNLRNLDTNISTVAANALLKIDPKLAYDSLIDTLSDTNNDELVRASAIAALMKIRSYALQLFYMYSSMQSRDSSLSMPITIFKDISIFSSRESDMHISDLCVNMLNKSNMQTESFKKEVISAMLSTTPESLESELVAGLDVQHVLSLLSDILSNHDYTEEIKSNALYLIELLATQKILTSTESTVYGKIIDILNESSDLGIRVEAIIALNAIDSTSITQFLCRKLISAADGLNSPIWDALYRGDKHEWYPYMSDEKCSAFQALRTKVLVELSKQDPRKVVDYIIATLHDSDTFGNEAVNVLKNMEKSMIVPILIDKLDNLDRSLEHNRNIIIGIIRILWEIDPDVDAGRLSSLLNDKNIAIMRAAVEAHWNLSPDITERYLINKLVNSAGKLINSAGKLINSADKLINFNEDVMKEAGNLLGKLSPDTAKKVLQNILDTSGDKNVRRTSLELLTGILIETEPDKVIEHIQNVIFTSDVDSTKTITDILCNLGPSNPVTNVEKKMLQLLAETNLEKLPDTVIQYITYELGHFNNAIVMAAIKTLEKIAKKVDPNKAVEPLIEILSVVSEDLEIKTAAIKALEEIAPDNEVVKSLIDEFNLVTKTHELFQTGAIKSIKTFVRSLSTYAIKPGCDIDKISEVLEIIKENAGKLKTDVEKMDASLSMSSKMEKAPEGHPSRGFDSMSSKTEKAPEGHPSRGFNL